MSVPNFVVAELFGRNSLLADDVGTEQKIFETDLFRQDFCGFVVLGIMSDVVTVVNDAAL